MNAIAIVQCHHKHTGSCSPDGIYLYVACQDCRAILDESPRGKELRETCPGYDERGYTRGLCKHCGHDAMYHVGRLTTDNNRMREALERIARMPMEHKYREGCLCMGCVPKAAALAALPSG